MKIFFLIVFLGMIGGLLVEAALIPSPDPLIASWYGDECKGKLMANGKPFNPNLLTCASWNYPFGTLLRVTHKKKSVVVKVTDRGPNKRLNRAIDLSRAAFQALADTKLGLIEVQITKL